MEDNWQVKTRCESLKKKCVDMHNSQSSDSERCDSVELDDKIRILIRKNDTPASCKKAEDSSCALNAFEKSKSQNCSGQRQVVMESKKISESISECIFTKNLTDTLLQQKIILLEKQKQELLSVNNQWDQHFRQMKQHYDKKVTEMKAKLETVQKIVRDLEQERYQTQEECKRLEDFMGSRLVQEMVQIYEEDFKKERSDREKLSKEKESLQKLNEQSQSQLNKLKSQIKHYQAENELLQKQVKQQAQDFQALTENYFCLQRFFFPSCLNCGNCGLLRTSCEPRITLGSCVLTENSSSRCKLRFCQQKD